jgi:hypothetical protein
MKGRMKSSRLSCGIVHAVSRGSRCFPCKAALFSCLGSCVVARSNRWPDSLLATTLEELVKAPTQGPITPETKLKVIKEVLDRAAAAPERRGELQANLQSMSDEELRNSARRLLSSAEQAAGSSRN